MFVVKVARRRYASCGQFVDIFVDQSYLTCESMGSDISFRIHISMAHQCFDRECVITCHFPWFGLQPQHCGKNLLGRAAF
jgi:hypothetical protein